MRDGEERQKRDGGHEQRHDAGGDRKRHDASAARNAGELEQAVRQRDRSDMQQRLGMSRHDFENERRDEKPGRSNRRLLRDAPRREQHKR